MKFGVIVFPGTAYEQDIYYVLKKVMGQSVEFIGHDEHRVSAYDCLVLPGGRSYGNYYRPGALASQAPVMTAIIDYASAGGLVLGINNGFQILLEAGLLPGAMQLNKDLQFCCRWAHLRVENENTPFTSRFQRKQVIRMPIAHQEGNYYADEDTLAVLEANRQVVLRYCTPAGEITVESNPDGSVTNIAGITNREGNILGLMPYPERCAESLLGGSDGYELLGAIVDCWSRGEHRGS